MAERHPVQAKAGQGTQSTVRKRENRLFYQGGRGYVIVLEIISAAKGVDVNKSPCSGAVWK